MFIQFVDSIITKIFVFQFINSYASFFYLAFVATYFGDCPSAGCMGILGTNLAIIFGARIVVANFQEVIIPYYIHKYNMEQMAAHALGKLTRPEKELALNEASE